MFGMRARRRAKGGHVAEGTRRGWVAACSLVLAAFTVFVLLDTFAIGRVQQQVQEADLSNIVQAPAPAPDGKPEAGAGERDGADTASELDATSESDVTSESGAAEDIPSASGGGASGHRHGKHGGPGGKPGASHSGGAGASGAGASSSDGASGTSASGDSNSPAGSMASGTLEEGAASAAAQGQVVGSYSSDNMSITVSQLRAYDTNVYIADVQVASAEYLKTALAQNAFGRNLKDTTSNMAQQAGSVLAVNGDYYGFRDDGYVVRNGVLYRDTAASGTDALVVYGDGTMASVSQDEKTAQELVDEGAWQVFSFGPTLVANGELAVAADSEVSQSMGSNPRTAVGMISPLHYLVVVSDGRTGDDAGLSLYQLAQVMVDNGATYAYNLDGGGSTTMWFQGQVLNTPTSGNRSGERQVSDIVYFG